MLYIISDLAIHVVGQEFYNQPEYDVVLIANVEHGMW